MNGLLFYNQKRGSPSVWNFLWRNIYKTITSFCNNAMTHYYKPDKFSSHQKIEIRTTTLRGRYTFSTYNIHSYNQNKWDVTTGPKYAKFEKECDHPSPTQHFLAAPKLKLPYLEKVMDTIKLRCEGKIHNDFDLQTLLRVHKYMTWVHTYILFLSVK